MGIHLNFCDSFFLDEVFETLVIFLGETDLHAVAFAFPDLGKRERRGPYLNFPLFRQIDNVVQALNPVWIGLGYQFDPKARVPIVFRNISQTRFLLDDRYIHVREGRP